ncbi:hypothetical protein [Montanilutibacter psychrotolerans]|uniref:YbjN domain-containing protein n=1 Tax=Montanilutibacter psychrotolerans TaxID=1327343 RepID=A0A3M8SPT3_9GAMM|nr:hypothetical protein [Lysobacter psychrotolerans]RNF83358.1 hypothetical protein EER27_12775 [Lysobacter psychrotolerans]
MRLSAPLFALLLLSSLPAVHAQAAETAVARSTTPDAGVKRILDSLDYDYEVDEDGDFKMTFELDDERTQLVYVISSVEEYGSNKIREIWSPAYRQEGGQFPANIANRLLEESHSGKMGSWVKQDDMAVLVIKIAADASADELDDAINYAMFTADKLEASLTGGKDDF